MSEHEVSRVLQATSSAVFEVASDIERLPEWLPTVKHAQTTRDGEVELEGSSGDGSYDSTGFWRPQPDQRRIEWSTPSRDGEQGTYAGWLQVADSGQGGSEVTVHLSFFDASRAPSDVEGELTQSLAALADLVGR